MKGFTAKQIKEELDLVHGDSAPSKSTVCEWVRRFKAGQESLEDDPNHGFIKTAVTEENVNLIEKIVLSDQRLKVREIAEESGLSYGTTFNILHDHLYMRKISARWEKKFFLQFNKNKEKKLVNCFCCCMVPSKRTFGNGF